jgi:hypothetical protein
MNGAMSFIDGQYKKSGIYGDYSNVLSIDQWAENILKNVYENRCLKTDEDKKIYNKYRSFFKYELISTYGWGESQEIGKKRMEIFLDTMQRMKDNEKKIQEKRDDFVKKE